jgi:flagellar biosynthesis protein FlhB
VEASDLERTEPATPRRIERARDEGDVPRSRELATCVLLLAAGTGLWFTGNRTIGELGAMLATGLTLERELAFDSHALLERIAAMLAPVLVAFLPVVALLLVAVLLAPAALGGLVFSTTLLVPKFNRMNPVKGIANIFSSRTAVELAKAIAKAVLVGGVALAFFTASLDALLALVLQSPVAGIARVGLLVAATFMALAATLLLVVLIDVPYQLWHHAKKLRMSREEVRRESKESEGDPHVKARVRALQREMARRRMMAAVPTADVVVTNPTHYAVALSYTDGAMRAPRVVAKGADAVAARIRALAAEHGVPQLEAPALARALHRHTDIGDEIPASLYSAVAEVLAWVYRLRAHRTGDAPKPARPASIDVPPGLDPGPGASAAPNASANAAPDTVPLG